MDVTSRDVKIQLTFKSPSRPPARPCLMASLLLWLSGRALGARGSSQVTGAGGDAVQLALVAGNVFALLCLLHTCPQSQSHTPGTAQLQSQHHCTDGVARQSPALSLSVLPQLSSVDRDAAGTQATLRVKGKNGRRKAFQV